MAVEASYSEAEAQAGQGSSPSSTQKRGTEMPSILGPVGVVETHFRVGHLLVVRELFLKMCHLPE